MRFLRYLKTKVRSDLPGKPVLLIDGAPAHIASDSMKLCQQLFYPLQNVAHSCDFNSIVSVIIPKRKNRGGDRKKQRQLF